MQRGAGPTLGGPPRQRTARWPLSAGEREERERRGEEQEGEERS